MIAESSSYLTGIPALDVCIILGVIATGIGGIAALWRAVRALVRMAGRVNDFLDDWNGEPQRPGVPARPGVMERLSKTEERQSMTELDVIQLRQILDGLR